MLWMPQNRAWQVTKAQLLSTATTTSMSQRPWSAHTSPSNGMLLEAMSTFPSCGPLVARVTVRPLVARFRYGD